jgi:chromosome segregation ATPase
MKLNEKQEMSARAEQAEARMAELEKRFKERDREARAYNDALQEIADMCDASVGVLIVKAATDSVEAVLEKLGKAEARVAELEKRFKERDHDVRELEERLSMVPGLKARRNAAEAAVRELEDRNQRLESDVYELKLHLVTEQAAVSDRDKEIERLEARVAELEKELAEEREVATAAVNRHTDKSAPPVHAEAAPSSVDHPAHYGGADNPLEAIKVIEHYKLGFNLGNTVKYVLRAGKKGDRAEDLRKAAWYLARELNGGARG